jgi:NAD-dependent deacetylase
VLEAATVYFGEPLDAAVLDAAAQAAADCDVFLAVGTSLGVHPAAGLVEVAAAHGARIVIVNAEPTPYDGLADLVVREPISEVLPGLLGSGTRLS